VLLLRASSSEGIEEALLKHFASLPVEEGQGTVLGSTESTPRSELVSLSWSALDIPGNDNSDTVVSTCSTDCTCRVQPHGAVDSGVWSTQSTGPSLIDLINHSATDSAMLEMPHADGSLAVVMNIYGVA
jgi:hypothetical protein